MKPIVEYRGIELYTFSLMMILAVVTCILVLFFSKKTFLAVKIRVIDYRFIFFAAIPAVLSGKLLYALIQIFINGSKDVKLLLNGFVFYGGLLGFELGIWLYCRRIRIDYYAINDVIIMVFPLGQSIGRIGCYFNGCCYGRKTDCVIGIKYVLDGISVKIYPTWFMESIGCLLIFLLLYYLSGKVKRGMETIIYFVLYPVLRFLVEFYRGDCVRGYIGVLSVSQWISIMILIANFFQYRTLKKNGIG